MQFSSTQIKGAGRGHGVGFPTINLVVPDSISPDEGIYAAWVEIEKIKYRGALHYGSIPTFDLNNKSMEVHLIDITDDTVPKTEGKEIKINIVGKIRNVKKFNSKEELTNAIRDDVKKVKIILVK